MAELLRHTLSDVGQAMFLAATNDIPLAEFRAAVSRACRECKFFPSPVELRSLIGDGQVLTADSRAVLAWDRVLDAIRSVGGYQSVEFDDPLIHATVRTIAGSWEALCDTPSDDLLTWKRKEFIATYSAHCAGGSLSASSASALGGIFATDAGRCGYDEPDPVLIGTRLPPARIRVVGELQKPPRRIAVVLGELAQSLGLPEPEVPKPVPANPPRYEQVAMLKNKYGL